MTKLLAPITLAILTTACATAGYPMQQMPPDVSGKANVRATAMAAQAGYQLPVLPIGRWDNVMMLAAGTPVQVLLMDGGVATGLVHAADSTSLSLKVASGEVELASTRIMRVDRLASADSAVKDGARGAAFGAGVVGVHRPDCGEGPTGAIVRRGQHHRRLQQRGARCDGPQKRDDLPCAGSGAEWPGECTIDPEGGSSPALKTMSDFFRPLAAGCLVLSATVGRLRRAHAAHGQLRSGSHAVSGLALSW